MVFGENNQLMTVRSQSQQARIQGVGAGAGTHPFPGTERHHSTYTIQ